MSTVPPKKRKKKREKNPINLKSLDEKRALTLSETAEYACVSEATVRNWINKRIIAFEELPGRGNGNYKFRLIRKTDLDIFLDTYYCEPIRLNRKKFADKVELIPKEKI